MNKISFLLRGNQTTIKKPFRIEGTSYYTGKRVALLCKPAKSNSGIVFVINKGIVEAKFGNLRKSRLHNHTTELYKNGRRVTTVEHILSAFYGMNVDNAIIEMSGREIPIFDASSRVYADKIFQSGIKKLPSKRKLLKIERSIVIKSRQGSKIAIVMPNKRATMRAIIEFNNIIGNQSVVVDLENSDFYYKQISSARSFMMDNFSLEKWEKLRKDFKALPKNYRHSNIIIYNKKRFLTKLRYRDEPVRHKILDFLGDFSLLGHRIRGEIILFKPGHSFTHQILKEIREEIKKLKNLK